MAKERDLIHGPLASGIAAYALPVALTGMSLGATVVIATALGEGNEERVHRGVHTSLLLSLIAGVLAAIIGEIGIMPIVGMMDVPQEVFSADFPAYVQS